MYLDVDGRPVEVNGHPPGSAMENGYYRQRMYHGLVASCAKTGDLIDGEIRTIRGVESFLHITYDPLESPHRPSDVPITVNLDDFPATPVYER